MRILYVVHRYGEGIVGGAESACRAMSEKLVSRGHQVEVLTSCAKSYIDWANSYPAGSVTEHGVVVHRLSVDAPRDPEAFSALHHEVMANSASATLSHQIEWLDAMGPVLRGQSTWLRENADRFDVAVFMTYLYPTTAFGVPTLSGRIPVVIQPTAHDEPPIHLSYFRSMFEMADGFVFLTPEERDVVESILGRPTVGQVVGLGVSGEAHGAHSAGFRSRFNLGDDPYLIYVGRIDAMKGVTELMRFFVEYKGHHPGPLKLVLAGEAAIDIPDYEGFVPVGFLSEEEKSEAIRGALALVQPSPYESFSIVLCESWREGRPVLVQGHSPVLTGQAIRSQGGFPYVGYAEFDACVSMLVDDPRLAAELGENGRRFVIDNYDWAEVLDRMEEALSLAIRGFGSRR